MGEYRYNELAFATLCEKKGLRNVDLKKMLGMTNTDTINRWRRGEAIRSDAMANICTALGVAPDTFFTLDGQPLCEVGEQKPISAQEKSQNVQLLLLQQEMQFKEQIAAMEREHLRELMQKDIEVAKKEADMREEIRTAIKQEYESEITRLRTQLIELSAQYKELELLGGRGNVTAVADNHGRNYVTHKG